MTKRNQKENGYTLLFAVLTAALVLGVAAFILGVARKQYIISATARDSMFSFYNADSALSCILQSWDSSTSTPKAKCNLSQYGSQTQELTFSFQEYTSSVGWTGPSMFVDTSHPGTLFGGKAWSAGGLNGGYGIPIDFGSTVGCALVKIWVGYNSTVKLATVIESRGYNVPCDTVGGIISPSVSRRNVERAIRITQQ